MEVVLLSKKIEELKDEMRALPDGSRLKIEVAEENGCHPVVSIYSEAMGYPHRFQGLTVDGDSDELTKVLSWSGIAVARVEKGQDPKKHAATSLNFESPYSVTLYCVKRGQPECYKIADAITEQCDTLEDV